ncbi:MAG: ATP-binding protein [Syntrophomonadaceae bacterium]|nr:ATP-binding protein [Syntrophomonadaceae bacterium]
MSSILETCQPRPEILAGTFNPEVFTVSLSPIIKYYAQGGSGVDNVYTNASLFFKEATYPTQGLKQALSEVFARLGGNMTVPAIHRLETAFGGGKTHTLIACTHIAHQGINLAADVAGIIDKSLLPTPGSINVVGIAGDEIPVHKPQGDRLIPYTLWGEIAYQIGGETLYSEVETEATSHAAPGLPYLEKVFDGRRVLIMLDELAQYAARLEAAHPEGAQQLAAFLMSLIGHARNNPGIAIVLTLASAADAFARQTAQLALLVSQVKGEEVSEDAALGLGEQAVKGISSVVARDAVQVTPVQAAEISSVFAKRLFISVDRDAASTTADEYLQLYKRNKDILPEEASSDNMYNRMLANYPFHPTLVDFLTHKLTSAENFQGTRGVLRVLALVVRSLWLETTAVPMIHACHLDMRSDRVVNELLGRTGSSNLMFILNADVGSIDTENLEGGRSNAQQADIRNPHPARYPLYEYTWKTVFLHSLVGRNEGLNSNLFGISEMEAMLAVSFPGLTPPQVKAALDEIKESAYYLRSEQGRYFASEEPTVNNILARIRGNIGIDPVKELLADTARKQITARAGFFHVETDISLPEHLPDGKGKPVLGVVSLSAASVDVEAIVTSRGDQRPREQQNLIFILVPDTVMVQGLGEETGLFTTQQTHSVEARQYLENLGRQVMAMRLLAQKPQNWGIHPRRLEESDYKKRQTEREQALAIAVASTYTSLYYPSTTGSIIRKEIKSAGGEGGVPFIEVIRQSLLDDGELITSNHVTQADLLNITALFFEQGDTVSLEKLRQNFNCVRRWPVLEDSGVLEQIIRAGVNKNTWCLYRYSDENNERPDEFYYQEKNIPLGINLSDAGYGLVTIAGARQRDWMPRPRADLNQVRQQVYQQVSQTGKAKVEDLAGALDGAPGEATTATLNDAVRTLVKAGQLVAYHGSPDQEEKPELISGTAAVMYNPQAGDVIITAQEAKARGWLQESVENSFKLSGSEGVKRLQPLVRRLGSIYNRGATTRMDSLDITRLKLPGEGELRLELVNAGPEDIKALGELFEILDQVVKWDDDSDVYLVVDNPDESCLFMQELKKE